MHVTSAAGAPDGAGAGGVNAFNSDASWHAYSSVSVNQMGSVDVLAMNPLKHSYRLLEAQVQVARQAGSNFKLEVPGLELRSASSFIRFIFFGTGAGPVPVIRLLRAAVSANNKNARSAMFHSSAIFIRLRHRCPSALIFRSRTAGLRSGVHGVCSRCTHAARDCLSTAGGGSIAVPRGPSLPRNTGLLCGAASRAAARRGLPR